MFTYFTRRGTFLHKCLHLNPFSLGPSPWNNQEVPIWRRGGGRITVLYFNYVLLRIANRGFFFVISVAILKNNSSFPGFRKKKYLHRGFILKVCVFLFDSSWDSFFFYRACLHIFCILQWGIPSKDYNFISDTLTSSEKKFF